MYRIKSHSLNLRGTPRISIRKTYTVCNLAKLTKTQPMFLLFIFSFFLQLLCRIHDKQKYFHTNYNLCRNIIWLICDPFFFEILMYDCFHAPFARVARPDDHFKTIMDIVSW